MIITDDMNLKPWKYATHCLKLDDTCIFICHGVNQFAFLKGSWKLYSINNVLLKEIEYEHHPDINEDYSLISRSLIQKYQKVLDEDGFEELYKQDTELCNSNSLGAVPHIMAIRVVLFNNDLEF